MSRRSFCSEYVNHCMRFYARYPEATFHSEVDKYNWEACEYVLNTFSDDEREMLLTIYREGDTIQDNIYQIAKSKGISQGGIWKLVNEMERKIAKRRGLV